MNIDWSKAPEGFPLWVEDLHPERGGDESGWCNEDLQSPDGTYWDALNEGGDFRIHRKPEPWNGEGLPPVGTRCETVCGGIVRKVEILCVTDRSVFMREPERDIEWVWDRKNPGSRTFRPIRTPEQIAAEEREAELNRMVATVQMLDKGWARKVCAALYDANYRKQVTP